MDTGYIHEKIGALSATARAAHSRIDNMERLMRDELSAMRTDLKELSAYMHQSKGRTAVIVAMSGAVGAMVVEAISYFLRK